MGWVMKNRRPILVTGAHRSGTTWVGQMLAVAPAVVYIEEPFHIVHDSGTCGAQFAKWFTYICTENEAEFATHLRKTTTLRYNLRRKIQSSHEMAELRDGIREAARFWWYRMGGARPLLKDPIAIFSAEWLATTFGTDNIVLIRHPVGFAGSLKSRG